MLSYNMPVSVNGQAQSPSNSSMARQSLSAASRMSVRPVAQSTTPASSSMAGPALSDDQEHHKYHHVWLVTGPAGCGKSTVAKYIANNLSLPYIEGDEFHPKANIDKMSHGTSLTDADRWDWLTNLREESLRQLSQGHDGVVLTCSALKRKYRDVIRVAPYFSPDLHLHFIYLDAPEELLLQRVSARKGHYMKTDMVHSQFEILERPGPDETDVTTVDVSRPIEDVEKDALASVLDIITREQ